jgi:hypothetical protein
VETAVYNADQAWSTPLDAFLARCEADAGVHMTDGACTERELRGVEERLGQVLPAPFRAFLARLGGGVFYLEHEIFGAHRVMIHDIELVPDLLSFRAWLGAAVPAHLLPIHRAGGRIHAIELGVGPCAAVRPLDGNGRQYRDFTAFLESVVLATARDNVRAR